MGNTSALASVAVLALGACGGGNSTVDAAIVIVPDASPDAKSIDAPPDARVYDFSCLNNTAPTTSAATVTISGTASAVELNGQTPSIVPLAGATVDACKGNCIGANKLDTQTSAMTTGAFMTASLTTGGAPGLDGYVKVAKATYRTSNVYPSKPVNADLAGVPGLVFSAGAFQGLQLLAGNVTQSPQKGNLGLVVTDCSLALMAGAAITVQQGGNDVAGATVVDPSTINPAAAGTFFVLNVPPGVTEVGATFMGMTLRTHSVLVVAGQTTATQIKPGF